MSWFYKNALRPLLFAQDSENIHNRTMRMLGWASRHPAVCGALGSVYRPAPLPVKAFGLSFPNPVGLAAGMDKHAQALLAWEALGFGFSELGGATWLAQPGNPKPRMFRAVADEALINRMGFNNSGAQALAQNLARWKTAGLWPSHPVGINLGKSKATPLANAADDYRQSLEALWDKADFFVVNVSSPNTPGLRQLQDKKALDEILAALQEASQKLSANSKTPAPKKPILVKIAPDLSFEAIDEILELIPLRGFAGIVATNTTLSRPESKNPLLQKVYKEEGGLSGKPLAARSTDVIRHIARQSKRTIPIIGVGGIFTAEDAWQKICAGACLLQVYTGLVFEGPSVCRAIVEGLRRRMEQDKITDLASVVGRDL
jgi:dihydroorotate dehydrogenase